MTTIFHVDFYPKDFMLDTQRMTNEQRGAYIQIISAMMAHNGAIDDDNKWLSNLCNCSVRKFDTLKKELIKGKFISVLDGKIYQKRALEEVEKAQKRSENATKNARKRHENTPKTSRKSDEKEGELNENSDLNPASYQSPDTSHKDIPNGISKNTPQESGGKMIAQNEKKVPPALMPCANGIRFDEFWEEFPTQRRGSKKKAEQAYITALKEKRATEEEIINGVTAYRDSDEVANGFAKGAAAWLNDDRWANDYSIKPTQSAGIGNNRASYTDQLADASRIAQEGYDSNMPSGGWENISTVDTGHEAIPHEVSGTIPEWENGLGGESNQTQPDEGATAIGGLSLPSCASGNHSQASVEIIDAQDFGRGCEAESVPIEGLPREVKGSNGNSGF